ncbi:MAG: DUF4412 domain-containing protein [Bacteroidota bacterium]
MKRLNLFLLTITLIFTLPQDINAQILKKLKKKVQQAVEETVIDKTADKAAQETGKAMDSLLEIDPDYDPNTEEKLGNILYGNKENIPIEDVYNFTSSITYKMESNADNKQVSMDYNMLFTEKNNYMATKIQNIDSEELKGKQENFGMTTILDDKNQAMIILMEEQKIAQVLSMEKIKDINIEEEPDVDNIDMNIVKTGKSKKILGYHCEEFKSTSKEGNSTIWITKELSVFHKDMFANLNKSLGGNQFEQFPDMEGVMMEMNFIGNNGDKVNMKAVDISEKNTNISTAGYQFMNLSKFMK